LGCNLILSAWRAALPKKGGQLRLCQFAPLNGGRQESRQSKLFGAFISFFGFEITSGF